MRCTAVVWIAMAGCSDVESSALPSAVTGRFEYRYVDHAPPVAMPMDLSTRTFQVYVADDTAADGFARYPPEGPITGSADGTFEIDDVPAGAFWLRSQPMDSWPVFTHELTHEVVATNDVLGRPDAVPLSYSATTPVALEVTGLAPWSTNDYLIADCWGNATENYAVGSSLMPPLTAGATAINASFNWNNSYSWGPPNGPYLMAARDGDFVLSRTQNSTASGLTVRVLTQVMTAPAVDQVQGIASTIRGTFADVPLDRSVSISIDPAAIPGALPVGNEATGMAVWLLAGPGSGMGLALGPFLYEASTATTTALHVDGSYGDPFDAAWPVIALGSVDLRQPNLDLVSQYGFISSAAILVGGSYVFAPPPLPQEPTLDGISLDGRAIGWNGVSPLELQLHVTGAASQSVMLFSANPAGSTAVPLAAIVSQDAPLVLPPELLHVGNMYALRLGAWDGATPSSGSYVMTPPFTLVQK